MEDWAEIRRLHRAEGMPGAGRLAGGDPARVRFVEIPFDQMPAALDGGRVDAAWMAEPAQTIAEAQGARVVASPFEETDPKLTVATYFTSTRLAQQNPAWSSGSPRR